MANPRTALLLDPLFREHDPGEGHPERPARYDALTKTLGGFVSVTLPVKARAATDDELALCHTRQYLAQARTEIEAGQHQLSTGDTSVNRRSWDVAVRAAGGVMAAVDAVVSGAARNAFCAVRPPGHHATPSRGMGFCVVNSVATAARYAQKRHGIGRVLIADWDVHHGNGTQDIFYADGSVLFFSTHQWPWYPGTGATSETGEGAGAGLTVNCPLPAGSGADAVLGSFRRKLLPAARSFRPELVLISAGFDSRAGDPLGRFTLTDADFVTLTRLMMELADEHAGGRLVSVLEGGYSLEGLSAATAAHVTELSR